ncbi:MAG TPA: M3 family metallopeptidase [Steroidobacteraceae bacterium]|nr:M3 family metallopeptidase [Steroidobacteraceae bacterium]
MNTANPLLAGSTLPAFDAIRPEHVESGIRELLDDSRERVRQIEQTEPATFGTVIEPLEELGHRLSRIWSPVGHLNGVMNNEALREKYNACLPLLSAYGTDLSQNERLFRAYEKVRTAEAASLDAEQLAVVDHALLEFRLAGVALDGAKKERFKAVMLELASLAAKFEENVLDATNAFTHEVASAEELAGLNAVIVAQARERAEAAGKPGWLLGLDQPTYVAVVTDARSPDLRKTFYRAWSTRASDQGPSAGKFDNLTVMEKLLALRHESAQLLGYPNYAAYALARRMARSVDEVLAFLRQMAAAARPAAERELAELTAFAGRPLDAWDITYYSERLQEERYSISQEELRPYFPLPRVLDGVFGVIGRLFGISFRPRADVPLWHPDARYYDVLSAGGEVVGGVYLDPYARPNKRSGAWMDDCVGRKQLATGTALPVAYLVCNALPGAEGQPAQLTHDDVVTLFHEFGHGLHHLLTRVKYPSIAGINGVAWDAVELPSQFFENYAWQPEVLRSIAQHVETGEVLPTEKITQLLRTRSFQAGLATLRQVEFALLDFRLHAEYEPARGARIAELLAEVRSEVAVIQIPEWNRFPNSFGHIFAGGYAAGYYSYKWAEVLSADAFAAFEEAGIYDAPMARRFVDNILSRGGSRNALDAFVAFRGRPPSIEPLLRLHGIAPPAKP